MAPKRESGKLVAENRKARFNYDIGAAPQDVDLVRFPIEFFTAEAEAKAADARTRLRVAAERDGAAERLAQLVGVARPFQVAGEQRRLGDAGAHHVDRDVVPRVLARERLGQRDQPALAGGVHGLAGGADVILIPEIPYDVEKVAECTRQREARGARFSIVVVAEGARPVDGGLSVIEAAKAGHAERLGGAGALCSKQLGDRTGKETRHVVLGHLQRGGTPTAFDRTLATRFGGKAVELLLHGHNHEQQLMWLDGPHSRIPAVGVPSASAIISTHDEPAAYNLYRVAGGPGAWMCEMVSRGLREGHNGVTELTRHSLIG